MSQKTQLSEPKLAPPGAGLPVIELQFIRILFKVKRTFGSRDGLIAKFRREQAEIMKLVQICDSSQRGTRILVKWVPGLEDSSRYWSVWMVLEHLRITNLAFAKFVRLLARGTVPRTKVDTAMVKPSSVGEEVEVTFTESCEMFLKNIPSSQELENSATLTHPWFGPMNAYSWLALGSLHLSVHRRQLQRVIAGL